MERQDWERVSRIFSAVSQETGDRRESLLLELCGADEALSAEIRSLLDAESGSALVPCGADDLHADPDSADQTTALPQMDPYRPVLLLGRGGMGEVYLAEVSDGTVTRQVAVKILRTGLGSTETRGRFERERQILAELNHPFICPILDAGIAGDARPFFVMPFYEGATPINRYCAEQALALHDRLLLFLDVCDAVHHAHQHLVVHCDLKPGNVLVTSAGKALLMDFGIARILDPGRRDGLTTQFQARRPHTPEYASPEQVRGSPPTTASDVWGLGVVLYELLAGRRPFAVAHADAVEIENLVCEWTPPRPSTVDGRGRRALRGELDLIVMTALAKDPAQRYGSVSALADDLRRHLAGRPIDARAPKLRYRLASLVRRHPAAVAASVIALLSLLVFAFGMTLAANRIRGQAAELRAERDHIRDTLAASFIREEAVQDMVDALARSVTGTDVDIAEIEQQVQERLQEAYADDANARAAALHALATFHLRRKDYAPAERVAHQALELEGVEPVLRARLRLDLARLTRIRGQYAAAQAWVAPTRELWRSSPHRFRNELYFLAQLDAETMRYRGDAQGAVTILQQAADETMAVVGLDHPLSARLLRSLAIAEYGQAKIPQALASAERAWQIWQALGLQHSGPGQRAQVLLASFRMLQGDLQRSVPVFEQQLARQRELIGPSARLAADIASAGYANFVRGDVSRGLAQMAEATAMAGEYSGAGSLSQLWAGTDYAWALIWSRQTAMARQLLSNLVDGARSSGTTQLPLYGRALALRAGVYLEAGELRHADADLAQALAMLQAAGNEGQRYLGDALAVSADRALLSAEPERALATMDRVLEIFARWQPADHWETLAHRSRRAMTLAATADSASPGVATADAEFLAILAVLQSRFDPEHWLIRCISRVRRTTLDLPRATARLEQCAAEGG